MSLTFDDLKTVFRLFRESGYDELRLRIDSLSLTVRKDGVAAADQLAAADAVPGQAMVESAEAVDVVVVRATISGNSARIW